jgi:flagellar biosynthetic protein FliP
MMLELMDTSLSGKETLLSGSLQVIIFLTTLTVLPSVLLMMSAFTRIIIVLSILRQALGLAHTPPNQILIGLSLFLTFYVMNPTLTELNSQAIKPYAQKTMTFEQSVQKGGEIMRTFMLSQVRKKDIEMFAAIKKADRFESLDDIPYSILMPAFVTSELKTAFQIGFLIFLPFLIIDLVVALVLTALGMMMMSPTLVSMPLKILLFVTIDGWALTMGSLATSFGGG